MLEQQSNGNLGRLRTLKEFRRDPIREPVQLGIAPAINVVGNCERIGTPCNLGLEARDDTALDVAGIERRERILRAGASVASPRSRGLVIRRAFIGPTRLRSLGIT
jgi:hypothetical protein